MINFNSSLIIERIKSFRNLKSDRELSQFLNVPTSTLANWKSRNTFPMETAFLLANQFNVSLDWLLAGVETKQTNALENLILTVFNALGDSEKLNAVAYLTNLNSQNMNNANSISQSANGDVTNMVAGDLYKK